MSTENGIMLYEASSGITQIPAEEGPSTPVIERGDKQGLPTNGFPFFLPNGKRFVTPASSNIEAAGNIELASLGSADRKIVICDVVSAPIVAPVPGSMGSFD